jgi:hypothetical protein
LVNFHPTAASTILDITYGYTPHSVDDQFIRLANEAVFESFRYGGPGSSIFDLFPFRMSPPFLYASLRFNEEESKTLADVDAVFVLSEARCLHSDDCGEAFQLAASVGGNSDGIELGCPAGPA